MIDEADIPSVVHLNNRELIICLLNVFDFSEKDMEFVTDYSPSDIKTIKTMLRAKLGGANSKGMRLHAQQKGFKIDGTLNGDDILSGEQKRRVLVVDPSIEFRFPIKTLDHAPL